MSDHHRIFTQFFLDPEIIFSSHTMFILASKKEFTPIYLVTFNISHSLIRIKFYSVYSFNSSIDKIFTDSKIQGCYMSLYSSYVMQLHRVLSIIISDLQFTTSKSYIH